MVGSKAGMALLYNELGITQKLPNFALQGTEAYIQRWAFNSSVAEQFITAW